MVATARDLTDVRVLERAGGQAPSNAKYAREAQFGSSIRLLGFDLKPDPGQNGSVKAGEPLSISLLWQAEAEPGQPYTVFVQLLNAEGKLVAQHDGPPNAGRSPTNGWLAGDRVADEHRLELPKDLPPGDYRLIGGLYGADGQRLTLPDGQNFAELNTLKVR